MKFITMVLVLTSCLLPACSKANPPFEFQGEFEVFRNDGQQVSYAVILYANGAAISSQRSAGVSDVPCRWSEEDGVIRLTEWDVSSLVSAFPDVIYEYESEMFLHRRMQEGSEVLVPAAAIEAFDAGNFAQCMIYWKAGPDAVVGYKTFWLKDEPGVRFVGKRFDQESTDRVDLNQ